MASDILIKYGTANITIVCTIEGLADNSARASTAIDNSINKYLDALVQGKAHVTTAPSGESNLLIYTYGTADGGTTYSGGATGTDADYGGVAGQLISNCKLLGIIDLDAAEETFESDTFSVAAAFGGVLPDHWGIIVVNQTGQAIATANLNGFSYQGIYALVS